MKYIPDLFVKIYKSSPYPVKNLSTNLYWMLKSLKERNSLYRDCLEELRKTSGYDTQQLKEIQLKRFIGIYKHAINTVPYYSKIYREYGLNENSIGSLEDIKKLPMIDKEVIRVNYKQFISSRPGSLQLIGETSGTTGKPIRVAIDKKTEAYNNAVMKFQEEIAGIQPEWFGVLAGYKILSLKQTKPPFWITNYLNKQVHYSSYHLDKNTFVHYEDHIRKRGIRFLRGYPTAIGSLAGYILNSGRKLKLDAVFVSSQPLEKWSRLAIENAFECKVYDFYSQVEKALWAISCGYGEDLHVVDPICIAEFERENKVEEPFIIATNLVNYYFPLIRYKLDDNSESSIEPDCLCGIKYSLMKPVRSRRGDFLITPSGRKIPAPSFTIVFWGLTGIIESQIEQLSPVKIIVRIVPAQHIRIDYDIIRKRIHEIVGTDMEVIVELCDKIKVSENGKRQFILRSPEIKEPG